VIAVTNVTPHVYGGVLESFDVTISDTSDGYVGVLSTIGGNAVPLDYITRWAGSPSGLRIDVDAPDVNVGAGIPVSLALVSSLPGQPTCITTISFNVGNSGSIAPYIAPTTPQTTTTGTPSTPVQNTGTSVAPTTTGGETVSSAANGTNPAMLATSTQTGLSTAAVGATVTSAGNMKLFNSICVGSNAYRLWFILLIIYIIIVAIVVFAEPWFLDDSVLVSTATILVPLILLLVFWYFSETCRAASWIPVVACVIAIVGLFLAFREYELPPLLPAASEH